MKFEIDVNSEEYQNLNVASMNLKHYLHELCSCETDWFVHTVFIDFMILMQNN